MNPTKAEGQLIQLDEARRALSKIARVDEAKKIRDKAEALRIYAKQQSIGLDSQNKAAEIKIRAERRAGELLDKVERTSGPPTKGKARPTPQRGELVTYEQTLKKAEIAPETARRWQKEAEIPEPVFNAYVAATKDAEQELTSAGVVRLAKSSDQAATIEREIKKDSKVLWLKHIGKMERLCRFLSESAGSVRKKDREQAKDALNRCIKTMRQAGRTL